MVPAKPFRLVRVRVEVPDLPCAMLRLAGLAEIPKSPPTVMVTVAEWLSPPPVPLTVTVYVPSVAAPALMERVEVADPPLEIVRLFGQRETTSAAEELEAVRETVAEKPLRLATVTVDVAEEPARVRDLLDGLVVRLKSRTLTVTVIAWRTPPLLVVRVKT